jgi:hypothetical protein
VVHGTYEAGAAAWSAAAIAAALAVLSTASAALSRLPAALVVLGLMAEASFAAPLFPVLSRILRLVGSFIHSINL